ncbi:hypothetical protein HHI36_012769 [Cryptolaemus montrouzieri]|uniref:DNA/RNA non-specific endonuclease/pyrophosphatase/phosphodiesterase domain-containing protein n=1 Tax=Cryptolaemus montrouzieri TaxID=559131 RepID=A0ABD2NGN0_9CUCU
MSKWIEKAQPSERIAWQSDAFYNLDKKSADQQYSLKSQRKQINYLLGLGPNSKSVIKDSGQLFLARGHLAAKGDFFYGAQQKSTFHLVNAAPQWQSFNNGNWKFLEQSIRQMATTRNLDLEIYTGTHEILTMRNNNTESNVELFLFSSNGEVGLPVPLFFWKIVFDPKSSAGVAFVGTNNPYITSSKLDEMRICKDVSERINWISLNNKKLQRGFTYACSVMEFRKNVKFVPNLKVNNLLV